MLALYFSGVSEEGTQRNETTLHGFYYDEEMTKGPITGAPDTKPVQEPNYQKRMKLLCSRELSGSVVRVNKKRCNFKEEILKTQASGMEIRFHGRPPFDESETQGLNGVTECEPVCVLPREAEEREAPRLLRTPARFRLASCISSIQLIGRPDASQGAALITTTGSAAGRPSVFILSLAEEPYMVTRRSLQGDVSSECPIWTADCDRSGSRAAIGTNLGAGLVDLETEAGSYFLPSESHVLVLQFHQSGNIVH
ncbi:hypothetical protein HID58_008788 [Brassica napus]|uniref:Uncharacterized protein n=1 Tax=Brassica napus TaxID=3708 RepID=A0ABQ8DT89_BRANA|nr:hypothetical protein HID58_008788 [Brassica napus]